MNAFDYLKSLIDDGYFDDPDKERPSGLRRLLAASGALINAQTTTETILPTQQDELVQYWRARQLEDNVDAAVT